MAEIVLTKASNGCLIPVDPQGVEYISKLKTGQGVKCKLSKHRNPGFHRKFFALLNFAFDVWEPEEKTYKGEPVLKEFEQFRNDVTVMAGYYETSITLKGEVRLKAKSISFDSMDQDEFERLYSATIDVILQKVLKMHSRADLDNVVENVLHFA